MIMALWGHVFNDYGHTFNDYGLVLMIMTIFLMIMTRIFSKKHDFYIKIVDFISSPLKSYTITHESIYFSCQNNANN